MYTFTGACCKTNRSNASVVLLTILSGFCITGTTEADDRRNVLVLVSDNHNVTDLGCYGNPVVQTPHLDQLAREGVRFPYAFATTASCSSSRGVMWTGLHTHANGQYGHSHGYHNFHMRPHVKSIFSLLKQAGYHTGVTGKYHIAPDPMDRLDLESYPRGRDVVGMARDAEKFFHDAADNPFFLVIGFVDPHPTSNTERPAWKIRRQFPGIEPVQYDPQDVIVPGYLPDQPEVREGLAGYYQLISRMDAGVGLVLSALQAAGKEDETLVIFFSDHGSTEPGAMATHYEPGVRVPFIVQHPKLGGRINNAMITLADVVPTILDWTGAKGPGYQLHGRSILPILGEQDPSGWDDVYLSHIFHEVTMYYPMRTVRTRRHKLIWNMAWRLRYPLPNDTVNFATWQEALRRGDEKLGPRPIKDFLFRPELELYDLKNDPLEVNNLSADPQFADLRDELFAKILAFQKRTGDPWLDNHQPPLPVEGITVGKP